jgi:putative ABC transport system permease protein
MREWWSKVWGSGARNRRRLDQELGEEIRAHMDLMADDRMAVGAAPEEARAAARRSFGNAAAVRERAADAWRFPTFESLLQDLRGGLRSIRQAPGFAAVVILTLALGIGANTAIFSVVYGVLLRPLPYPSGERLVLMGESAGKATGISVTWINYQHWRDENHVFSDMAALIQGVDLTLTGHGDAVLTHGSLVTSKYFALTGSVPMAGRLLADEDDRPGAAPAVLLSYDFWAKTLGADPHTVGSSLALNGKAYSVVGVLRPEVSPLLPDRDYYIALGPSAVRYVNRNQHGSIRALGLLKPGVTVAQARSNLDEIMQRLAIADPGPETDHLAYVQLVTERITRSIRTTLVVLMGAVGLVLLLACANVASLLLVRGAARSREMAIRTAIGAGRARLARQLLTENLVTTLLGGGLGVLLAAWSLRALVAAGPTAIPRLAEVRLDIPVLLFAAAVSILVGLAAGVAPVFTAARADLSGALREGSHGSGTGRRTQAFRNALVAAELAVTLVLSFGAGLLVRSLITAQHNNPGYDPAGLVALQLQLPGSRYKTDQQVVEYYARLTHDLRGLSGVESAGAASCPPSSGGCGDYWYSILELPAPARENVPGSFFKVADTEYFRTMRMRMLAGRTFTDQDRDGAPLVTVINEALARRWWPSPQLALGNSLKMGGPYQDGPTLRIVGVVGDASQNGLDSKAEPEFYFAMPQQASHAMVVMIRTARDPEALIPMVRRTVASIDAGIPIQSVRSFEKWLGTTLQRRRFTAMLLTAFAGLAVLLAAVGIYGVLKFWVGVRQREIAIRMAMGAQRSAILAWGAAHAARLVAAGVVVGGFGAWNAAGWLKSLVFGVSAQNPLMLVWAAVVVVAIAAAAAGLPLWRASRVDVVRNLHDA